MGRGKRLQAALATLRDLRTEARRNPSAANIRARQEAEKRFNDLLDGGEQ